MSETPIRGKEGAVAEKVETAFTLLLPLFSVFFIWQGTEVSEPPRNVVVGPRTFPLLIGCMMLAVSVVLVWQRWCALAPKAQGVAPEPQSDAVPMEQDETSISDWPAVWSVLGSLLALFLLLEPLGFVLALALFLFGLSTLFAPRQWLLSVGVSIGFSTFFYYLFTRILDIALPNGVLSSLF
jgi:putative tricarboxylic transport membrane protein